MNKTAQCDDRQLLTMLREELPADEMDGALAHIEDCGYCQDRLEKLSAPQNDWDRAARVLPDAATFETPVSGAEFAWTESMARQLLSPPSHPEMLGRIGRYEVERLIGAGGMGVVFKAYDTELNRPVAVKLLAPYLATSGPARQRFAREARAAAAIVHQHVVPIHNVETDRESPFLVMHYVAGESLQSRIGREGALELREILRIGLQVSAGLAAAHQQGLVHRDIKPSNILLEEESVERAMITDFGLARAANDASVTRTGAYMGTPQYMSPEQARGEAVDQQSDLYSLGSVLYAMCTGHPPFRAETPYGVIRRIAEEEPASIQHQNSEIPGWLCQVVARLMARRKEDRFESAGEVHELLEECLSHVQQPEQFPLPQPLTEAGGAGTGRRLKTALWGGFSSLLILLAGVIYYIQTDHGVVKIDVKDPSLKVAINDQTVTMREGNKQPLVIDAGESKLVIQQGDNKFESDTFKLSRDGRVVFSVDLLEGEVLVQKDGRQFQRMPVADNEPGDPAEEKQRQRIAKLTQELQAAIDALGDLRSEATTESEQLKSADAELTRIQAALSAEINVEVTGESVAELKKAVDKQLVSVVAKQAAGADSREMIQEFARLMLLKARHQQLTFLAANSSVAADNNSVPSRPVNEEKEVAVKPSDFIRLRLVEMANSTAVVDGCLLSAGFTQYRGFLQIKNTSNIERRVKFNYQAGVYNNTGHRHPPELIVLANSSCEVTLKPGESHQQNFGLMPLDDMTPSENHPEDNAVIRVSKSLIPLRFSTNPRGPISNGTEIGNRVATITAWEFVDRVPFSMKRSTATQGTEGELFTRVLSGPQEVRRDFFTGASDIAISDDEKYVVAAYYGGKTRTWDVMNNKPTSEERQLSLDCTQLGFVPNSSIAWTMDFGGSLRLYDAQSGELLRNDQGPSRGESYGTAPAFSPDGSVMVSANRPGKLEFWDVKKNVLIKLHDLQISKAAFSTDGKYCFIWRRANKEYEVSIWNPATGERVAGPFEDSRVTGPRWVISRLAFRHFTYVAEQQLLYTFENKDEEDETVMVIRSSAKADWPVERRVVFPFQVLDVHRLDKEYLLVDGLKKTTDPDQRHRALYRIPMNATRSEQAEVVSPERFSPYRFVLDAPGSRWLDVRIDRVTCWKLGADKPLWTREIPQMSGRVRGIPSKHNWILVHDRSGSGFVFDLTTGRELWRKNKLHWAEAAGSSIVLGDNNGVEVWQYRKLETDAAGDEIDGVLPATSSIALPPVSWPAMAISPNGSQVAAPVRGGTDRIAVWEVETGAEVMKITGSHDWQIPTLTWSPDGLRIVTASLDKTAKMWNAETGSQQAVMEGHGDRLCFVTFSPSGNYLLTASGANITTGRLWDGGSGEFVAELKGHTDKITMARFSTDEKLLLTAAQDGSARLWDVSTAKQLHVFEHKSTITSAQFSQDETRVLTASSGRTSWYATSNGVRLNEGSGPSDEHSVRVWDATSGKQLLRIDHPSGVTASLSPDSDQIVSVSGNQITWWDAKSGDRLADMESGGTQGRAVFSPDRRNVVVFYEGKTAQLWDVVARRRIGQLLTGDAQRNEWSSDSRTFYSLTRRGTLRSWDVEESREKLQ